MNIDFHTHILPAIDDGSIDTKTSIEMLKAELDQEVDVVILTPHFYASKDSLETFLKNREIAYSSLLKHCPANVPILRLGAEVAFFPGISKVESLTSLCIEGTNAILLEMPFSQWDEKEITEIKHLLRSGVVLILAHVERYVKYQKNKRVFDEILDLPLYTQINAECILSPFKRSMPIKLLKNEYANLLGSDCHNLTTRVPNMADGRRTIERILGKHILNKIDETGNEILNL